MYIVQVWTGPIPHLDYEFHGPFEDKAEARRYAHYWDKYKNNMAIVCEIKEPLHWSAF